MPKKEVPPDGSDKTPDTSSPGDPSDSPFDVDLDPSVGGDAGGDLPEGFPSADDLLGSDTVTASDTDDGSSTPGYEPLDIGPDENVIASSGPALYNADGEYTEVNPEDITPDIMASDDTGVLPDMAIVGPSDSADGAGLAETDDDITDTPSGSGDGSFNDDPPDPRGGGAAADPLDPRGGAAEAATDDADTVVAADSSGDDPIEEAAADEADTLVAEDPDSGDDVSDDTASDTEPADTADDAAEPSDDTSEDDADTSDDAAPEPEEESAPVEASAGDDAGGGDGD